MEEKKPLATFYAYDQDEVERYTNALKNELFLYTLDQELRAFLKYGHYFKTIDEAIEKIRQMVLSKEI